jgi:lysozyme
MAIKNDNPKITQQFYDHLHKREGSRERVYKDSQGNLTAGVGHLLSEDEQEKFKEGGRVPTHIRQQWLRDDTASAWGAASKQAKELGKPELTEALASVNFQLGNNWNQIHKKTWGLMKEGRFDAAAREAQNSKWFKQTPTRVTDLQKALRDLN